MNPARAMCQAIMDELPGAIDIAAFCTRLSALRDRRILLLPFAATAETPTGLWAKGQHQDYVFYDETASPVHQQAIIWHEVSHLILDHPGPRMDPEAARLLMPDLDPAVVLRMLGRSAYSQDIEREAEELASHLMLDLAHRKRRSARPPTAGDTPLERLKAALNYRDANG